MAGWNPIPQKLAAPSGGIGGGAQGNPAGSPMGTPGGKIGSTEWAKKNRTTLLAGGAGVVVLLALVAKRRAATGDTSAAAGTIAGASPQQMAAYDSSSADTYNALQPQLEQIRDLLENYGSKVLPLPDAPTDSVVTPTTSIPVPLVVTQSGTTMDRGATVQGMTLSNGSTQTQTTQTNGQSRTSQTVYVDGVPYYVNRENGAIAGNPYAGLNATTAAKLKAQLAASGWG